MQTSKLHYLLQLLDDDDQQIVQQISEEIIQLGLPIIPILENIQHQSDYTFLTAQIEDIIEQIQLQQLLQSIVQWAKQPTNLLEGLMLIASYQYPDLDKKWIQEKWTSICVNIDFEINRYQSPEENIQVINKYFYKTFGFVTPSPKELSPQHFFINHLLSHQKAHPTLLSILYVLIGQKLQLPIHAFEFDNEILLVYGMFDKQPQHPEDQLAHQISFFINPYEAGSIISKIELQNYLQQHVESLSKNLNWIQICSHQRLLTILAQQLRAVYWNSKITPSAYHLEQIISILEELK